MCPILLTGVRMLAVPQVIDSVRAAASSAAPARWWDHAKDTADIARGLAETFAFVSAGLFFLYKAISGYLVSNLTLSLSCERKFSGDNNLDYLLVTTLVKKGDRGAVILHDAEARVSPSSTANSEVKKLSGIIRLSFRRSNGILQIKEEQSKKAPLLNLSPGEETVFSTFFKVPSNAPCTIEVTLLGGWPWHFKTAYQWRASQVSLPIERDAPMRVI
jgi:hypothetical protein